jgi:hypothetical protein
VLCFLPRRFLIRTLRVSFAILFLTPALLWADTYVMQPAKEKATLLGSWDGGDISYDSDGYSVQMVLLAGDDGYLIWPMYTEDKSLRHSALFFGRLASLTFKDSHVKLLFRRLPDQVDVLGPVGYDAIEIKGDVVGLEGIKGKEDIAAIKGTITIHDGKTTQIRRLRLHKPELMDKFFAATKRAKELIAEEMKPGPKGSREDALAILRESGDISDKTRIVSAEWSESSRQWIVDLQHPAGKSVKIAVNVQAHDFYYVEPWHDQ